MMGRSTDEDFDSDGSSILKVVISTDNHLGFEEKHMIRGEDSFRAFEEVLALARHSEADMLLLGGDLFHENKPSRRTLLQTQNLLKKYCMGHRDVQVKYLSDPSVNFDSPDVDDVNYMSLVYKVDLPVFIIHGNHDDPTGAAGTIDQLSALDHLACGNLVNYFGRCTDAQDVKVSPVLLQKGKTKLALYGLGNIRDERLYQTWHEQKNVHFIKPPAAESADVEDEWYSTFLLHQNRAERHTVKSISSKLIPSWIDLVVWGHEHECRVDLEGGDEEEPPVTQPGSTVATSLCEGEAVPKHVAVLEIFKGQFRFKKVPLRYTREFTFENIVLQDYAELNPGDEIGLEKFLKQHVTELVTEAEQKFDRNHTAKERFDGEFGEMPFYQRKPPQSLRQPLIRVRIDHSGGFQSINPARFGQSFVGRVANASDILHFAKKRETTRSTFLRGVGAEELDIEALKPAESASAQDGIQVPDLVQFYLKNKKDMQIHPSTELSAAVEKFVVKNEPRAIQEFCEIAVTDTQKKLMESGAVILEEADIADYCTRDVQRRQEETKTGSSTRDVENMLKEVAPTLALTVENEIGAPGDNSDDDDDEEIKVSRAPPKRAPKKTTTRRVPEKSSTRKPPAGSSKKQGTLSFGKQTRSRNHGSQLMSEDDKDVEDVDDSDSWEESPARGSSLKKGATKSKQPASKKRKAEPRPTGRRATRTRLNTVETASRGPVKSLYDDDDDDEEEDARGSAWVPGQTSKRSAAGECCVGMGRINKKKGNNRAAKMKRRLAKSLDQIRTEMENPKEQEQEVDLDLPGLGRFGCVECDRHFVDDATLRGHRSTKGHKRRVKLLGEEPYTQETADRGAGMGKTDNGPARIHPV